MRVSALPAWLFVLFCVLLGTVGTGYYYVHLASVEVPTNSDERIDNSDPGNAPTAPGSGTRPKQGPKGVLLLVIQTRLVTEVQSELAQELRQVRKEHGGQLIDGSVFVVNGAGRSTWDLSLLREEHAIANDDIKRAMGRAREAVSAFQGRLRKDDQKPAVLLVWGNDVDPSTVTGLTREDVTMPRPVALFWIGYPAESRWMIEALGKGSIVCRLDRDIQNLSSIYLPEYLSPSLQEGTVP